MAGINLLPWREKAREAQKKQFQQLLAGSALFAVLGVLAGQQWVQGQIEHQNERNQRLTSEIAELDKQIKEIEALDATRQSLLDRIQVIEDLQSTRPAIVHLFDEMVTALPKGMYLTTLKQEGTTVHLAGKAESYARVSSYMDRLDASPWLSSSNLNVISTDHKAGEEDLPLRDFKLDVTQLLRQDENSNKETAPTQGQKPNSGAPASKPAATTQPAAVGGQP